MEIEKKVYSVKEFCESHSISKPTFFKWIKQGKAPKIIRINGRVLISKQAAKEWLENLEEICN